jgi:hypothetical protein
MEGSRVRRLKLINHSGVCVWCFARRCNCHQSTRSIHRTTQFAARGKRIAQHGSRCCDHQCAAQRKPMGLCWLCMLAQLLCRPDHVKGTRRDPGLGLVRHVAPRAVLIGS